MPRNPFFDCYDCSGVTCEYMVHDRVWLKAWPGYTRLRLQVAQEARSSGVPARLLLCLDCLEKRLGRLLTPEDFRLELPINAGIVLGLRMAGQ